MAMPPMRLGSTWTSPTDARTLNERAKQLRKMQQDTITRLDNRLKVRKDEISRSLIGIGGADRARVIRQAVSGRRKELLEESADIRKTYTTQLAEIAQRAKDAERLYPSAVAHLMMKTIGNDDRSRYAEQVARSGPTELRLMAEYAAFHKNRDLAAALVARVSEMKPSDRPFSTKELADVAVGDEFREVQMALASAQLISAEALYADAEIVTGQPNAQRRMEIAMMRKRLEVLGLEPDEDEDVGDNKEEQSEAEETTEA